MSQQPDASNYVWEKMYVAVESMCGSGTLAERLYNASISALMRLNEHDLPEGRLRDSLKDVLNWTKHNMAGDRAMKKLPDHSELNSLIENMLSILLATHRK